MARPVDPAAGHQAVGDVAQLTVPVLADSHEHGQRLLGGDPPALHEDALGDDGVAATTSPR